MYKIRGADGKEYGPVTLEQLRQWIVEGRANSQTYVQSPDSAEWKPLSAYPELASLLPPSATGPSGLGSGGGAPGMPPPGMGGVPAIPNYLWQSIVVTLCCCLPFGVVAIVFSSQVNSKLAAGDVAGAMNASQKAKMWCWIAFAVGVVLALVQLGYFSATNFHLPR
jgi:hypothetical protein